MNTRHLVIKMSRTFYLCLLLIVGSVANSWAQCSMCRAAVENNVSEGSAGLSASLNTGILYLFVAPYLLVAIIGYLWYKKSKVHARKIKVSGNFGG